VKCERADLPKAYRNHRVRTEALHRLSDEAGLADDRWHPSGPRLHAPCADTPPLRRSRLPPTDAPTAISAADLRGRQTPDGCKRDGPTPAAVARSTPSRHDSSQVNLAPPAPGPPGPSPAEASEQLPPTHAPASRTSASARHPTAALNPRTLSERISARRPEAIDRRLTAQGIDADDDLPTRTFNLAPHYHDRTGRRRRGRLRQYYESALLDVEASSQPSLLIFRHATHPFATCA